MTIMAMQSLFSDGFIEPVDVLSLRGNLLFGSAGSVGDSRMPPSPSVVSGAVRSGLMANRGVDLTAFAADSGLVKDDLFGSPSKAGAFTLCSMQPGRLRPDGSLEPLHGLPADLVATMNADGVMQMCALTPQVPPLGLSGSTALPMWPVLAQTNASKAIEGVRLTARGWKLHLDGLLARTTPESASDLTVAEDELWASELRIGIAMDAVSGRADDGKLFSTGVHAFKPGVGLLVRIQGLLLSEQILRFGGDGHGARLRPAHVDWPAADYESIVTAGRCRIILTSPGLFPDGWLPSGTQSPDSINGARFDLGGVRGRIVCAATPRGRVVSGFDLAAGRPKPAQRAAATGSVYWVDDLEASVDDLRALATTGLWQGEDYSHPRRAEGYNRFAFATWHSGA